MFQPTLGTNTESQENGGAHRTLVGLQQQESKLLDNRTMDRHVFKRTVCLSPKRGLFPGAEGGGVLFIPRLVEGPVE